MRMRTAPRKFGAPMLFKSYYIENFLNIDSSMSGIMHKIFHHMRITSVLFGTVVGAGFVSGAELVRFFPSRNFFPYVLAASLFFFFGFTVLFACGRKYGGFAGTVCSVFARHAPVVQAIVLASCLLTAAGMLAGLDAVLWEGFGVPKSLPVFSLGALTAAFFLSGKGTSALGWVNLCLVPAIFLFILALAFRPLDLSYAFAPARGGIGGAWLILLYAGMNVFLAAPVIADLGPEGGAPSAAAASAAVGGCILLILVTVFTAGADAAGAEMPLLAAVGANGVFGKLFATVSACGIVTTLFSSYYPLHRRAQRAKRPDRARAGACAAAFALSRLGLKNLVAYVYPALGVCGVLFVGGCAFFLLKERRRSLRAADQ